MREKKFGSDTGTLKHDGANEYNCMRDHFAVLVGICSNRDDFQQLFLVGICSNGDDFQDFVRHSFMLSFVPAADQHFVPTKKAES